MGNVMFGKAHSTVQAMITISPAMAEALDWTAAPIAKRDPNVLAVANLGNIN